jgi:hypothetical protein
LQLKKENKSWLQNKFRASAAEVSIKKAVKITAAKQFCSLFLTEQITAARTLLEA